MVKGLLIIDTNYVKTQGEQRVLKLKRGETGYSTHRRFRKPLFLLCVFIIIKGSSLKKIQPLINVPFMKKI